MIGFRLGAAPAELIDHVALVNSATGVPCVPASAHAPTDLIGDLQYAIDSLPSVVKGMLDNVLLGVYFARGLGSSAITDVVVDENGNLLGAAVVLDMDALQGRSGNEWATWKENTPFGGAGPLTLEVEIAAPDNDTRACAIQFLLLHEFGHVLSAGRRFLPIWWLGPDAIRTTSDYVFLQLAWRVEHDKRIVPAEKDEFAGRNAVAFYGGGQLDDNSMLSVYESIQRTSFPTLYASTNVYEDFAETFATYVHTVLMGKPFRVRICASGVAHMECENFWLSARSGPKRAFMEQFLALDKATQTG